jgi:NAD(P)-dependent dehydrogenase (short-subunit alcohol dehydrogenase family)
MISLYHDEQKNLRESIYNFYKNSKYNNCVTRQTQKTVYDLYKFEKEVKLEKHKFKNKNNNLRLRCYGCGEYTRKIHKNYVFSCIECGSTFQMYRHLSKNLDDKVALVVGGRTKLGHQVTLKLLKAGAKVFITTIESEKATKLFYEYSGHPDINMNNLVVLKLDLGTDNIDKDTKKIAKTIGHKLDILVFVAAQTIRFQEKTYKNWIINWLNRNIPKNRYGDVGQKEMEEIMRFNAVAPTILMQNMIPLMKNSEGLPYIINVHEREGLFQVKENGIHIHTNIGKACIAMLTKCLVESNLKTNKGEQFSIHGCDPGWISVDEYYEDDRPWNVPPLDEVDGAARILFPIFNNIIYSDSRTRRHFKILTY